MTTALSSVRDRLNDEQFKELSAYFDMAAHQLTKRFRFGAGIDPGRWPAPSKTMSRHWFEPGE